MGWVLTKHATSFKDVSQNYFIYLVYVKADMVMDYSEKHILFEIKKDMSQRGNSISLHAAFYVFE